MLIVEIKNNIIDGWKESLNEHASSWELSEQRDSINERLLVKYEINDIIEYYVCIREIWTYKMTLLSMYVLKKYEMNDIIEYLYVLEKYDLNLKTLVICVWISVIWIFI